jgi:hypothetical protein
MKLRARCPQALVIRVPLVTLITGCGIEHSESPMLWQRAILGGPDEFNVPIHRRSFLDYNHRRGHGGGTPSTPSTVEPEDAFEVGEQHLDLLSRSA